MGGHKGDRRRLHPGWGDSSQDRKEGAAAMMRDLGLHRPWEARLRQKTLAQTTCPERKPARWATIRIPLPFPVVYRVLVNSERGRMAKDSHC